MAVNQARRQLAFPPGNSGGPIEAKRGKIPSGAGRRQFPPGNSGGPIEAHTSARMRYATSPPFPPGNSGGPIEAGDLELNPQGDDIVSAG